MVVFISGWAQPNSALKPIADQLGVEAKLTSVYDFWKDCRPPIEKLSVYAEGLGQILKDGEKHTVIGWSMGGIAALECALAYPDKFEKLILLSSTARFVRGPNYNHGVETAILRGVIAGLYSDPKATLQAFFEKAYSKQGSEAALRQRDVALLMPPQSLADGLNYLLTTDLRSSLNELRVPLLLIHGTTDRIVPPRASEFISEQVPCSRLVLLPGCGHMFEGDDVRKIAAAIAEFTDA